MHQPASRGRHGAAVRALAGRRRLEAGHSLIELTVALVVLSIALATSVPAFHRLGDSNELVGATDELAGHLRITRQKAVSLGVPHVFIWNEVQQLYIIVCDTNGNGLPDAGEPRDGPFALPDGVSMHNAGDGGFTTSRVIFQPNGSANESGSIDITHDSGGEKRLTVLAPTGQVKID
ncbi:MAG: GspH/FimT family pseudopilin [Candidatus Eiseniibacteriota bacterium]